MDILKHTFLLLWILGLSGCVQHSYAQGNITGGQGGGGEDGGPDEVGPGSIGGAGGTNNKVDVSPEVPHKVCQGTRRKTSHSNSDTLYRELRRRYENCTYIDGNLEITFLEQLAHYDLSFLEYIKEVTGYVLIMIVHTDVIPLRNLRIIRGRELYEYDGKYYSLYVAKNSKPGSTDIGIRELQFTSLYEILNGDVFFFNNNMLCHENTINWNDILTGEGAKVTYHHSNTDVRRECEPCHPSCEYDGDRYCWGDGPDMCQTLTRIPCSKSCESRCFGPDPNQCCNSECAGGCTGSSKTECWACKNFDNEGQCVPFCPRETIYNPDTYRHEKNPNAKYTYGTLCVDKCPAHLWEDSGACVNDCGADRYTKDRKCVPCDGPCPKTCIGTGTDFLHTGEIERFRGCTIIQGSISILRSSFAGDDHRNLTGLTHKSLEVFETVREITGHLLIQADDPTFVDLSFFKNLEVIHGTILDSVSASLNIYGSSLKKLSMVSLRQISNGLVLISKNLDLCYAETIDWSKMVTDPKRQTIIVRDNHRNCSGEGLVCDNECSDGCWGPGPRQCLSCKHYHLDNVCLKSCDTSAGMFDADNKTCKRCHEQCRLQCTGDGSDHCLLCENVKDGPYCVAKCPEEKYPDENNICQMCHKNCDGGCTGPENNIGPGACNACHMAVIDANSDNITACLREDSDCDDGYYARVRNKKEGGPMVGKMVCMPCHPFCKRCVSGGVHYGLTCSECRHYVELDQCVANCSRLSYPDVALGQCIPCHKSCAGCLGPTNGDCLACKNYKTYSHLENKKMETDTFNCSDQCPEYAPYVEATGGMGDGMVCIAKAPGLSKATLSAIIAPILVVTLIIALVLVIYFCYRRAKAMESKMRLTAKMSGYDDESEPLTPSAAKPDMASLRFIKESELRRGNIIGSGAFGTVYKGVWIPEGENVKIPVAIKVLQEGTSPNQNKELLEEARIMASVDNVNCIRILAVCMTQQMMLITQLMPLGCLLDYVRKHKANIGSKVLLNWCTQIARGMAYLENERGIVHRDLAARNVLVQSNHQVRITDFGLAKLLDYNEEEFHGTGGKMPIKWLALECIHNRVFTNKSDVWSFGVTIWELFTYGQRPYENVRARDIPDLLAKGERLPQPSICTIDVYMIMIKCWMLDAQSRPNFKELADEFAKMSRDPGRYLVITGDSLLRLPSHSYDSKDLVRNMSIAGDGPEEIVDAEEYLQPQAPLPHNRPVALGGKLEKVPAGTVPRGGAAAGAGPVSIDSSGHRRGAPRTPGSSGDVFYPSSSSSPPHRSGHHLPMHDFSNNSSHGAGRPPPYQRHPSSTAHPPTSSHSSSSSLPRYPTKSTSSPNSSSSPHVQEEANYDNDRLIANDSCAAAAAAAASGSDHPDYSSGAHPGRREIKYSGLEAAAAARKQREINAASPNARDSVKSRYSSDPCKVLGPGDNTIPEESSDQLDAADIPMQVPVGLPPAPPTPMGGPKEGHLFSKAQRLPVDEDDYLTPKSSNPKAYIDLVEDYLPPSEVGDGPEVDDGPKQNYGYMDMSPTHLDNPEYFESTDPSNPGIGMNKLNNHHPHHAPKAPNSPLKQNGDVKSAEQTPLRMRSMSSESDGANSEHDYYNETDVLNRKAGVNMGGKNNGLKHPVMFVPPRTESTV